jgi:hypothetical protein
MRYAGLTLPWFCARLDTFNSVPAVPNRAVTRPSELGNLAEDKRQGCRLTERNKSLPRNRHVDDKQNALAVVVTSATHTVFGTVCMYMS